MSSKTIIISLIVLIIALGAYTFNLSKNTKLAFGAAQYNCELSDGIFTGQRCQCPIEEELGQTQKSMYDQETGFCQTTFGGPGGDAFMASVGLPFGDYQFLMDALVQECTNSGGTMSGASCQCPEGTGYDQETLNCK